MFKNNKNLFVIAVIAVVNALGYGIIIPILYTYSHKFGLSDFENGLLFSTFSLCQFFATPVIGRMSDKYGRKPLLLISLAGTALSFLIMAFAPTAIFLFFARALDGITAGNLPVTSAVISDTTAPKDRAKGFGIIGASFGFGFVFGPAISALTLGFGDSVPFLIAAVVTIIAIVLTWLILPETNIHIGQIKKGRLFDFGKLFKSLFDQQVGMTLLVSFIYSLALSVFIYAFQPYSVKILLLSAVQISLNFTLFGLVGVITQAILMPWLVRKYSDKQLLSGALVLSVCTFLFLFFNRYYILFVLILLFHALANAIINPVIQSLLSKEMDAKSQGSILGVNASYQSVGMILGPIIGGILATWLIPLPFLAGSLLVAVCFILSIKTFNKPHPLQHAF